MAPDRTDIFDVLKSPNQKNETEVAMMGKLQHHVLTIMRPFVDHLDQLFTAVESLGDDLAEEKTISRVQHDATSLRLSNLDETISLHLAEFENAPPDQRNHSLVGVMEQRLEEQQCRLTALVSDLRQEFTRKLPSLLAESKGPMAKLFEQQDEMRHVMNIVEERLDKSVCDWQTTFDALRQDFDSKTESLKNGTHSKTDALQHDLYSHAERLACLDARLQELLPSVDAMREAVGAVQPTLNKLTQVQFDAFEKRLSSLERELKTETQSLNMFGTKIAETQAIAGALQLGLQEKADIVQEVAGLLSATNSRITDKLEPALEEQKRRMTELEARDMEKASDIESRLSDGSASMGEMRERMEDIKRAIHDVTSKLVTTGSLHAAKPDQDGPGTANFATNDVAANLATNDVEKQSGKADASSHQPCRLQRIVMNPLPRSRISTGPAPVHEGLTSKPVAASGGFQRRSLSSPRASSPRARDLGSKTCFQGLPTRSLVITTFPGNNA